MKKFKTLITFIVISLLSFTVYADSSSKSFEELSDGILNQIDVIRDCNEDIKAEVMAIRNNNEYMKVINEKDLEKIENLTKVNEAYNKKLAEDSVNIIKLTQKVKFWFKIALAGILFFGAFIVVHIITIVLKHKGIDLPEWIDELL